MAREELLTESMKYERHSLTCIIACFCWSEVPIRRHIWVFGLHPVSLSFRYNRGLLVCIQSVFVFVPTWCRLLWSGALAVVACLVIYSRIPVWVNDIRGFLLHLFWITSKLGNNRDNVPPVKARLFSGTPSREAFLCLPFQLQGVCEKNKTHKRW